MKTNKLCLLLALSLLFLILFSCGDSNENNSSVNPDNPQATDPNGNQQIEETTKNPLFIDDLPEIIFCRWKA